MQKQLEPKNDYTIENETGKFHLNGDSQFHCNNGPAIIYLNGNKEWYQKGKLHRLDGPAIDYNDGLLTEYWVNGVQHTKEEFDNIYRAPLNKVYVYREHPNGIKTTHQNGVLHSQRGPAVEGPLSKESITLNNHVLSGPVINFLNSYKEYWLDGKHLSPIEFNAINKSKPFENQTIIIDNVEYTLK